MRPVPRRLRSRLQASAFTLVELLVVIAVIAILASMAAPTLIDALKQAQKSQCKSNLRQTSSTLLIYAKDHSTCLPYFVPGMPYGREHTYSLEPFDDQGHYDMRRNGVWGGLGLLYRHHYAADHRIFYCPSAEADGMTPRGYTFTPIASATSTIRSSYLYRVPSSLLITDSKKGRSLALVMDNLIGTGYEPDPLVRDHELGINVLYNDGHVEWFTDARGQYVYLWGDHWKNFLPIADRRTYTATGG